MSLRDNLELLSSKRRKIGTCGSVCFFALILFCGRAFSVVEIISHRGVHQPVHQKIVMDEITLPDSQCTAPLIEKVDHPFIENTIPSIEAAFKNGATMVEIDLQSTADHEVVVFHDHDLNCRTNAKEQGCAGESCFITRQKFPFLKKLDVGYHYTADGGKTFPVRGKGVGLMPTLDEVLKAFPEKKFYLDVQEERKSTLRLALETLKKHSPAIHKNIYWYFSSEALADEARQALPDSQMLWSPESRIRSCLTWYLALGSWLGFLPGSCEKADLALPFKHFKDMGENAHRFIRKLKKAGSTLTVVFVVTEEEANYMKPFEDVHVFTERVERVGPPLSKSQSAKVTPR